MKILYVLLALTVIKCILLYKVFHSIPALELKRRARTGDKRAKTLHRIAAYGQSLDVLLWLIGTAAGLVLFVWSARTSWWLAAIVLVLTAWLVAWARFTAGGWAGRLAMFAAPAYGVILSFTDPVLRQITRVF